MFSLLHRNCLNNVFSVASELFKQCFLCCIGIVLTMFSLLHRNCFNNAYSVALELYKQCLFCCIGIVLTMLILSVAVELF